MGQGRILQVPDQKNFVESAFMGIEEPTATWGANAVKKVAFDYCYFLASCNMPPVFHQVHWNYYIKLNNFLLFFSPLHTQCFVSSTNICYCRMSNYCGRAKLLWLEGFCKNMGFYIRQTWRFWLVWGSSKWGRNKKPGKLRDCSLCLVCYLRRKHSWFYRKLS